MKNYLSDLASLLQGMAGAIPDAQPGNLKSTLQEASRALDSQSVRVNYPPHGKPEIVSARGNHRQLTLRERLAIRILGGRTEIRP